MACSLWAQIEMPSMPSMPSISMPSMPTMGSTYYKPQMPEYYKGKPTTTTTTTNNTQGNTTNTTGTTTTTSPVTSITNPLVTSSTLSSLNDSTLSALDVSTLYNSGLFDSISSLLGTGTTSSVDNTSTNILLQQILISLNELKSQNGVQSSQNAQTVQNTSDFQKRQPSILRFKINGNSIVDSFKTVFFSESEADGTFLLTADRVYYVNQRAMKETIYLLFKTKRNNGSTTIYTVVPTLMQDSPNQNSFLYRMCEQIDIEAQKTGNLVAVHMSKDQFSLDILLDLDN